MCAPKPMLVKVVVAMPRGVKDSPLAVSHPRRKRILELVICDATTGEPPERLCHPVPIGL